MTSKLFAIIFIGVGLLFVSSKQSHSKETSHVEFVAEYIRELGRFQRLRASANEGLKDKTANPLAGCIYNMTRFELELKSQILMLQNMRLKPPFEDLITNISSLYELKANLYNRLGEICSVMIAGQKPSVDYGALLAEAPKINAQLDDVDSTLFHSAPLVFATLIDPLPDANNHMSKLVITKSQRKKLVDEINSEFDEELEKKDQSYLVQAAFVLKAYLLKDYSASDEPK